MDGLKKTHFLNSEAIRLNKSLGDLAGLSGFGFHIIEVEPGRETFRGIVVGERLQHDVGEYPHQGKRIYRNAGMKWNLVDLDAINEPTGGTKK